MDQSRTYATKYRYNNLIANVSNLAVKEISLPQKNYLTNIENS